MSFIELRCFDCKKRIQISKEFSRREECSECGADVHSCKNCKFYDEGSYNECRETSSDVVRDKERANHCDYFKINTEAEGSGDSQTDLLAAAEALFKK